MSSRSVVRYRIERMMPLFFWTACDGYCGKEYRREHMWRVSRGSGMTCGVYCDSCARSLTDRTRDGEPLPMPGHQRALMFHLRKSEGDSREAEHGGRAE